MTNEEEAEGTTETETNDIAEVDTEANDMVSVEEASDEELSEAKAAYEKYGNNFVEKMLSHDQPDANEAEEVDALEEEGTDETPKDTSNSEWVSKKDFDALKKQFDGLEHLRKRDVSKFADHKKEFLETRQEIKQLRDVLESGLQEKIDAGETQEVFKDMRMIEKADERIAAIDQEVAYQENTKLFEEIVAKHVKPGELEAIDIAATLKESGLSTKDISQVMANPQMAFTPGEFLQLIGRARAEKYLRRLVPAFMKQREELAAIRGGKNGDSTFRKINRELRKPQSVNGSSGNSGSSGKFLSLTDDEIANLDDNQLKQARAALRSI